MSQRARFALSQADFNSLASLLLVEEPHYLVLLFELGLQVHSGIVLLLAPFVETVVGLSQLRKLLCYFRNVPLELFLQLLFNHALRGPDALLIFRTLH